MPILRFLRWNPLSAGIMELMLCASLPAFAQQGLTWDQIRAKFEADNPALKADAVNVDEMQAEEITAYLRPNPQLGLLADGTQIVPHDGVWTPFKGTYEQSSISYLHERDHKRELRLESAKEGTRIAASDHEDLQRNLEFDLRSAFVRHARGKGSSRVGQGRPGILRPDHCHQPRPLQGRRHCTSRFGPHRVAARAIRSRKFNRLSSTCAPRKFNYCRCSTTALRWTSST